VCEWLVRSDRGGNTKGKKKTSHFVELLLERIGRVATRRRRLTRLRSAVGGGGGVDGEWLDGGADGGERVEARLEQRVLGFESGDVGLDGGFGHEDLLRVEVTTGV
jgi:hypothetical protein